MLQHVALTNPDIITCFLCLLQAALPEVGTGAGTNLPVGGESIKLDDKGPTIGTSQRIEYIHRGVFMSSVKLTALSMLSKAGHVPSVCSDRGR